MGEFSAGWLALREPADRAARSDRVTGALAAALPLTGTLAVVDLGAGAGANLRYLSPRLRAPQRWRLVDHDADLLALAPMGTIAPGVEVETALGDLAAIGEEIVPAGCTLVTASALLDLVSESWLTRLADRCRDRQAAVLFGLTYTGRIACTPEDRVDSAIAGLVNAHQRTDKGFGPALGPEAPRRARDTFAARGYHVECGSSDWRLGPDHAALVGELVEGWARAALAVEPDERRAIELWRDRRLAQALAGALRVVVGHEDLAAWPEADARR
jgi:hypothetical protein